LAKALDFGMGATGAFVMAPGGDPATNHEDSPNGWIRACLTETLARFLQRCAHQNLVVPCESHRQRYLGSIIQANWLLGLV
jgi:hypothetical protein